MATETAAVDESPNQVWFDATLAGLAAAVPMGLVMHFGLGVMRFVGALYGVQTSLGGWVLHVAIAVLFALVFAALVSVEELAPYARNPVTGAALGVVWAMVLWLIAASIIQPIWSGAVTPTDPPIPNVVLTAGGTHFLYGVILGSVFGYLRDRS